MYLAKKKPLILNGEEVALKVIFLGNPRLSETSISCLKQGALASGSVAYALLHWPSYH